MNASVQKFGGLTSRQWRIVRWSLPVVLLAIPAVAMQLGGETNWGPADFLMMGAMLFGIAGIYEVFTRAPRGSGYRLGLALALLAAFLLTWVNLAVGIIGSEDNPTNQMFFAIPAVAGAGALIAQFKPRGMAWAMVAAAVAQVTVALIAHLQGHWTWVLAGVFTFLWLSSATLFRKAADL